MEIDMEDKSIETQLIDLEKKIIFLDNKIEKINDKIETIYQNTILINKNILNNSDKHNIILNTLLYYMKYIFDFLKTLFNIY